MVAVHLYGIPVDLGRIRQLAGSTGALLIEDAAQGIGGSLNGKPLGAGGDLGVLSFGRGKGLTGGGGGALLATTQAGRNTLGSYSLPLLEARGNLKAILGSVAQWGLGRPSLYGIPSSLPFLKLGETVFHEPHQPGTMTAVSAGILARNLESVQDEAAVRRRNAEQLKAQLSGGLVPAAEGGEPAYLRLPVLVNEKARLLFASSRAQALGIMPGYPRVLNELPGRTGSSESFPGASQLVDGLFTLPVHSRVTRGDLVAIEKFLRAT